VLEAAVVLIRLDDGFGLLAKHPASRALPELEIILPEIHLRLHELGRIGHHARGHLQESAAETERISGRNTRSTIGLAA
jgi:hypothetical protein